MYNVVSSVASDSDDGSNESTDGGPLDWTHYEQVAQQFRKRDKDDELRRRRIWNANCALRKPFEFLSPLALLDVTTPELLVWLSVTVGLNCIWEYAIAPLFRGDVYWTHVVLLAIFVYTHTVEEAATASTNNRHQTATAAESYSRLCLAHATVMCTIIVTTLNAYWQLLVGIPVCMWLMGPWSRQTPHLFWILDLCHYAYHVVLVWLISEEHQVWWLLAFVMPALRYILYMVTFRLLRSPPPPEYTGTRFHLSVTFPACVVLMAVDDFYVFIAISVWWTLLDTFFVYRSVLFMVIQPWLNMLALCVVLVLDDERDTHTIMLAARAGVVVFIPAVELAVFRCMPVYSFYRDGTYKNMLPPSLFKYSISIMSLIVLAHYHSF